MAASAGDTRGGNAFERNVAHVLPTPFTPRRFVYAICHLLIPVVLGRFWFPSGGAAERLLLALGHAPVPVSPARARLHLALCALYGAKWALGGIVMLSGVGSWAVALAIPAMHTLPFAITHLIAISPQPWWSPSPTLPTELDWLDGVVVGFAVLSAVLGQGAELQRFIFKRDPTNLGKLHTGGLFAYAHFINHTGFILDHVVNVLLPRSWVQLVGPFGPIAATRVIVRDVVPTTVMHMQKKYGSAYAAYQRATPWLYVPGIY